MIAGKFNDSITNKDVHSLNIVQPSTSKVTTVEPGREVHTVVNGTPAQDQSSEFSFLQTNSTTDETVLQQILKHILEMKQDYRNLKHEFIKFREKVELKLAQGDNPEVAAAISGIVNEEFSKVPLTNFPDLNDLELMVSKESSKATSLARFLCRGSGFTNANALTLLILKRLLSREIAMQFSLEGRQGKRKFCELNLFLVVIASVKIKFPEAETSTISARISRVLAGSADWDGNRMRQRRKGQELKEIQNI